MHSRPVNVSASLLGSFGLLALFAACGGARATDPAAGSPSSAGAASGAAADGGTSTSEGAQASGPAARPFAASAGEATQLIADAVDKKSAGMQKCVAEYRVRKNLPHERVSVQLGIDQEGRLLGASLPRGKNDPTLSACVQKALVDAPFPRSHTGVISITKSYEEIVQ